MSRFGDEYDEDFNNQAALWHANLKRALAGKRGRKALAELREALLALPEKRLISGALCTVGGEDRYDMHDTRDPRGYREAEMRAKIAEEGEGVCAIGAFLWFKKVKAGADPEEAFSKLPTLLDIDGGDTATAQAGRDAGLTFTLAWTLAYKNDEEFCDTPEARYEAFMAWLDEQLAVPA